jgi:hypothetical protein
MASKPVLYSSWKSSCAWRVRIALAWKGIEYTYKAVHLAKDGDQHKDEFSKLNPNKVECVDARFNADHTLNADSFIVWIRAACTGD